MKVKFDINKDIDKFKTVISNFIGFGSYKIISHHEEALKLLRLDDETLKNYYKDNVRLLFEAISADKAEAFLDNEKVNSYLKEHKFIFYMKKFSDGKVDVRKVLKRKLNLNLAVALLCFLYKEQIISEFIQLKKNTSARNELKKKSKSYGYIINGKNINKYLEGISNIENAEKYNNYIYNIEDFFYVSWPKAYDKYNDIAWKNLSENNSEGYIVKTDIKNAFPSFTINKEENIEIFKSKWSKSIIARLFLINIYSYKLLTNKKEEYYGIAYGNLFESYVIGNFFIHDFKYQLIEELESEHAIDDEITNAFTYVDDYLFVVKTKNNLSKDKLLEKWKNYFKKPFSYIFKWNGEDISNVDIELSDRKTEIFSDQDRVEFYRNTSSYDMGIDAEYIDDDESDNLENEREIEKTKIKLAIKELKFNNVIPEDIILNNINNKYLYKLFLYLLEEQKYRLNFSEIIYSLDKKIISKINSFYKKQKNFSKDDHEDDIKSIRNYILENLKKISWTPERERKFYEIKNMWIEYCNEVYSNALVDIENYNNASFIIEEIKRSKNKYNEYVVLKSIFKYWKNNDDVFSSKNMRKILEDDNNDKQDKELEDIYEYICKEEKEGESKNSLPKSILEKILSKNNKYFEIKRIIKQIVYIIHSKTDTLFWRRFTLLLEMSKTRVDLFTNLISLLKHIESFDVNREKDQNNNIQFYLKPSIYYKVEDKDEAAIKILKMIFRIKDKFTKKNYTFYRRIDFLVCFRFYIKQLWKNGSRELEHFSNHAVNHIDNLAFYYKQFRDFLSLSDPISWVSVLSIYLHDISLLDDRLVKSNPVFINALFELKNSSNNKDVLTQSYFNLRNKMSSAIRLHHGKTSAIIGGHLYKKNILKNKLGVLINKKHFVNSLRGAEFHNGDKYSDIMAFNTKSNDISSYIVSLVDLLDVNSSRIGRPFYNIGTSTATGITKRFWFKDLSVIQNTFTLSNNTKINFKLKINTRVFYMLTEYIKKYIDDLTKIEKSNFVFPYLSLYGVVQRGEISNEHMINYLIFSLFSTEILYYPDAIREKNGIWTFKNTVGASTELQINKGSSPDALLYRDMNINNTNENDLWLIQIAKSYIDEIVSKGKEYNEFSKFPNEKDSFEKKERKTFQYFLKNILVKNNVLK